MKRSRFIVAGLLAIGLGVMAVPTASAAGMAEYRPCSDQFRLPWELGSPSPYVVLSPFGTADMYCASWHGFTDIYQLDQGGKKHWINKASVNLGSIDLPLGFYVWDPTAF